MARERTALAWQRSALAMLAIAAATARTGVSGDETALGIAGAAVLVAAACVIWLAGERLYRDRHHRRPVDPAAHRRALGLLSGASVFSAVVTTVILLASQG